MRGAVIRWLVLFLAVFVAAHLPFLGITYRSWTDLVVAALILAVVNAFVRPVLLLISLPLILISFGLFILVINALLLLLVSGLMGGGFVVPGFWSAVGGSLVISLVSFFLGPDSDRQRTRVVIHRGKGEGPSDRRPPPPPGQGPVIDI